MYYVWYTTYKYDSDSLEIMDDLDAVLKFLNAHAGNRDFEFRVVFGTEVKFRAVEVVKQYVKE